MTSDLVMPKEPPPVNGIASLKAVVAGNLGLNGEVEGVVSTGSWWVWCRAAAGLRRAPLCSCRPPLQLVTASRASGGAPGPWPTYPRRVSLASGALRQRQSPEEQAAGDRTRCSTGRMEPFPKRRAGADQGMRAGVHAGNSRETRVRRSSQARINLGPGHAASEVEVRKNGRMASRCSHRRSRRQQVQPVEADQPTATARTARCRRCRAKSVAARCPRSSVPTGTGRIPAAPAHLHVGGRRRRA